MCLSLGLQWGPQSVGLVLGAQVGVVSIWSLGGWDCL